MPGPKVSKAVSCRHDADPVLGDALIAEDSRNRRLRRFFFPRVKQGDIEITLLVKGKLTGADIQQDAGRATVFRYRIG